MAEPKQVIRPDTPECAVCKRKPEQIPVYVEFGLMDGITATDYVYMNEGTFNYLNNLFYCDKCYIKIGMPSGKAVPI